MLFIRVILILFAISSSIGVASAQRDSILVNDRDTIHYTYTPYRAESREKKMDLSFVIAPAYTNTTSILLGGMVTGEYNLNSHKPSTLSFVGAASIKGYYTVGVNGVNIFKDDRQMLLYTLSFASLPQDFWGIGYLSAVNNSPIRYRTNNCLLSTGYLYRLVDNLSVGTQVGFDFLQCSQGVTEQFVTYINGGPTRVLSSSLSLLVQYDSTDVNADISGIYTSAQIMLRPKWLGDLDYNCWRVNLTVDYYRQLWKGSVFATDLYAEYNSKNTPWLLYPQTGGTNRLRGYYQGRFMDRNLVSLQVELRQNVWKQLGVVAWGGAANYFGDVDTFNWSYTLPTYGLGLRWRLKPSITFRIDYGFGKKVNDRLINGCVISLNEAF